MARPVPYLLALALASAGAGLIAPTHADAVPVRGTSKAKPANFPQIKARLAQSGKVGKQAYNELKAVWRSEQRLRPERLRVERIALAASDAFKANPDPATLAAWKAAYQAALPAQRAHQNAANALESVKEKVSYTMAGRHDELVTIRAMRVRQAEMAARRAQPLFSSRSQAAPTPVAPAKYPVPAGLLSRMNAVSRSDSFGPQRPIAVALKQDSRDQTQSNGQ